MLSFEDARSFFAEEVRLSAGIRNPWLRKAFAAVPRERFFGPGPWRIVIPDLIQWPLYAETDDDDPRWLCHDVSVAIDESRHLVSGRPSVLARYIDRLNLRPGERVLHVGSGVGYFTAVLAETVGAAGRVIATEADPGLYERACANLQSFRSVSVHCGSGLPAGMEPVDAILINAGVTHLEPQWLDLLRDNGRLLAPLMCSVPPTSGQGFLFSILRSGDRYAAEPVMPSAGYAAVGLRDPEMEAMLVKAFVSGEILKVRAVRRDPHPAGPSCVLHREGSCLALAA